MDFGEISIESVEGKLKAVNEEISRLYQQDERHPRLPALHLLSAAYMNRIALLLSACVRRPENPCASFKALCQENGDAVTDEDFVAVFNLPGTACMMAQGFLNKHVAHELLMTARSTISPHTAHQVKNGQGYEFCGMLAAQAGCCLYTVFKGAYLYCAKPLVRGDENAMRAAAREVTASDEVHSTLRCPTLIKVIESFNTDKHTILILPLLARTAKDMLSSMPPGPGGIGSPAIAAITTGVLSSLAGLALTRWCHGDVKPENVMFSANEGQVVVIDLGSSTRVDETIEGTTPKFSLDLPKTGGLRFDLACLSTTLWALSGRPMDVCCDMPPAQFLSVVNNVPETGTELALQLIELLMEPVAAGDVGFDTLEKSIWPAVLERVGQQLGDAEVERFKAWWPVRL